MIAIELCKKDGTVKSAKIKGTELTAPTVIQDRRGNFYVKVPVDPRITAGKPDYPLQYRQCRGEALSSIEIVRSLSEEIA
jgi:hypothetical protein